MTLSLWIIALVTLVETVLIALVFAFFLRLRRSETLLSELQSSQESVMDRLRKNADLEQILVETFAQRQDQLVKLNEQMEGRIEILKKLLDQADSIRRSPQFLRELILNGRSKGKTAAQIARSTGLTVDEVEIILTQAEETSA